MRPQQVSSHAFEQSGTQALRLADQGVVFVIEEGAPTHVLLSMEDYRRLTGGSMGASPAQLSLAQALAADMECADIDFHPARLNIVFKPAQLD